MIIRVKRCDSCNTVTACRHSGSRWLCPSCWSALIDPPEKAA